MKHLKTIAVILLLSNALFSCKTEKKESQPNIVVILCDDLGYGDLSSFGHSVIKTPNLDQLAEDGIKMSSFYSAAPVCSPSRAGLLTGRSPNRAGIYDFIPGPRKSEDCRDLVHLQVHEKTIPALLKTVGYSTCLSGKWHCSSYFNSDKQPTPGDLGFDYWFATHNNAAPSHENPRNFVRNGEDVGELQGFSCQLVVDEALNWLKNKKEDNPFYLQVCFHEPHEPIASPQDLVQKYMPKAENENQAEYFANVANMDKAVGRLFDYLKNNYGENTLVVFSSDNGPETLNRYSRAIHSYGSPGPLKGMKLWTTEAGFRVPGILYWMGKETFNGTTDAVVSSLDFMPTFAEISGATLPDVILDGQSIIPLIETGSMNRVKPLTWAFYDAINERMVAMRTNDWKIMCRLKSDTSYVENFHNIYDGNERMINEAELTDFLLYNMNEDISESTDVSEKYPEKFEEMKELLKSEYAALLEGSFVWERKE
ncbi:sulfatase-like hydrolase/transferase [uncultured Draconibacterium sp.]|uniref:sulfatase family protein n=1 Tax=uncultured Draconibacterium sp. TaxID=1573823 RepID=UPI0029C862D1|nr:sulfatase-like hydrolase/transferase [uncultured Draconibacterium sp.]